MTPYEIQILMHYYIHLGSDTPEMERNPPIFRETMDWFVAEDLLRVKTGDSDNHYEITLRGMCYVAEGLTKVPLPEWSVKCLSHL